MKSALAKAVHEYYGRLIRPIVNNDPKGTMPEDMFFWADFMNLRDYDSLHPERKMTLDAIVSEIFLPAILPYVQRDPLDREFVAEVLQSWISPRDRLPDKPGKSDYEQIDCLVVYKDEVRKLVWNCEHYVWDDESGDDFFCNPMDVQWWKPLDEPPSTKKEVQ